MIKYIITSGTSVVNELLEQDFTAVRLTTKASPIHFDKIGEAMVAADKVNKILGTTCFRVVSVEV